MRATVKAKQFLQQNFKMKFYLILLLLLSCCCHPQQMYSYKGKNPQDNNIRKAEVASVIDGDTLWVNIYHSKNLISRQKIRLKDVRAYEIHTLDGVNDKENLEKILGENAVISVQLFNRWSYDRQEAIIYFDGTNINEVLKDRKQGGR